jgi:hypothetical protein
MAARDFAYYLGLDLGQSADYTALALIEEPVWVSGRWTSPATMTRPHYDVLRAESDRARPPNPPLSVRHLERFDLGTRYTTIVERVKEMANAPPLPESATLKRELLSFRVKVNPATAHDSYEHWREGDHDDLVLATAMACWFREASYAMVEAHYAEEERNSESNGRS